MNSPFPGIDPYIEVQGHWPDFHSRFLTYLSDALEDRLPGDYVAKMQEKVHLVRPGDDASIIWPDVALMQNPRPTRELAPGNGVATLEPVIVALERDDLEQVREVWIEIRRLPDFSLVTVLELLSPANKVGQVRYEYLDKRRELIDRPVHVVELDFLLGGRRLPMQGPLPPGDAYAIVSRSGRRPAAEVYAWSLKDGLPTIPVPLAAPDPDIPLDLAPAFETAYRRGRYARMIRYWDAYPLPIPPERCAWIEGVAKGDRT